jgi:hypothetical protein
MSQFSDLGAAVIGSGFIGTVHIEALRRLGMCVRGVPDSSDERALERACAIGVQEGIAASLPGGHVEGFGDTFHALLREVYQTILAGAPRANPAYATFRGRSPPDAGRRWRRPQRPRATLAGGRPGPARSQKRRTTCSSAS